jgi:hypothetical protein
MKHCVNCNTDFESSENNCPNCGHEVAANTIVRDVKTAIQAKAVCLLNGHDWFGCECKRCGATRDQGHQFQPVDGKKGTCVKKCKVCGKTKKEHHYQLIEGKCEQKCLICDKIEEIPHDWKGAKCKRCGELDDVWYVKIWAVILLLILFFPVGFYLMWKYQPWHKYIKIGITVVISVFFLIAIISPGGGSNLDPSNEVIMPASARRYVGENYKTVVSQLEDIGFKNIKTEKLEDLITGWLTKDGEIDQISINGDSKFTDGDKFSKDAKITITYHTFPVVAETTAEATKPSEVATGTDESTVKANVTITETTTVPPEDTIITVKNNKEFATIMSLNNDSHPKTLEFAVNNVGRTIEFDGIIDYSEHSIDYFGKPYKTRFDMLIIQENYKGPYFKLEEVTYLDFHFTGSNIPSSVGKGTKLHIVAKIVESEHTVTRKYSDYLNNFQNWGGLIFLKIISAKAR